MADATTVTTVKDPGRITTSTTACVAMYRASAADVSCAGKGYTAVDVVHPLAVITAVPSRSGVSASAVAGTASISTVIVASAVDATVICLSSSSPALQIAVP
jgi:hypothetical protein